MFKPGHKGYKNGGRPRKEESKKKKKNLNTSLDTYRWALRKDWEKQAISRTLDPAEVDYYLYNNLPLDELYEKITYYNLHERDYDKNKNKKNKKYG